MTWYHTEIRRVSRDEWMTYTHETNTFGVGTTKFFAQEEARRIITETTGVSDPKIVWNEC